VTNNPKPVKDKRRFVQVNISPELDDMLQRWKESTGQSYADTLRQAAFEYLFPRQRMIAPRPPTELREVAAPLVTPPTPRQIRREIIAACARVLDPYLGTVPSLLESKEAGQRLEAILEGRRNDFEALGMDATGKSLLSILNTEASLDPRLHDTADRILKSIASERNGGAGPAKTVPSSAAQPGQGHEDASIARLQGVHDSTLDQAIIAPAPPRADSNTELIRESDESALGTPLTQEVAVPSPRNRIQEAIIADYLSWLESKCGILKGSELKSAFYGEVEARQQEIATAFKLAPFGNSGSPLPALSKAIIERIRSSEVARDDPRLQAMLNDLTSTMLTERKP
jgi:hypothetical protein